MNQEKIAIKFFAPVVEDTANALMRELDNAANQGVKELTLIISTPGGSVFHGISIYNYLKGLPIDKIITHNFGSVDSIGVVIYCAGEERLSSPQERFFIHGIQAQFPQGVNLEEPQLEERLKGIKIDIENIAKIITANCGKDYKDVYQAMIDRITLNPDQAKEWGLVNSVRSKLFTAGTRVISIQENPAQNPGFFIPPPRATSLDSTN